MPLINYIGNRQEALSGAGAGRVQRGPAPPPPSLSVDYLIVGGGGAPNNPATNGGCGGGVVSGSSSIVWNTTLSVIVGAGGTYSPYTNGASSSLSGSSFGLIGAGGATFNKSGGPQYFDAGTDNGGGAGSSKNGNNGLGGNGDGGTGSVWLNGLYYAGGGGGQNASAAPGLGGGGTQLTGVGPDGLPYQLNGYDGRGGGASYVGTTGGSGSVIVRYSTGSLRMASGGTQFESGGYFYHEFTGSGTLYYGY